MALGEEQFQEKLGEKALLIREHRGGKQSGEENNGSTFRT